MAVTRLGRYEVLEEIGRGTMGVVYRGHDPVIDRPVALKAVAIPEALPPARREAFLRRFAQEARIAGRLLHPNIVVTYDAATDEASGTPFIAMELVHGEALDRLMERLGRFPWQEALTIVIPLARALGAAHELNVIHRDVKPANVLITHRGVPKLTDFGIAKVSTSSLTGSGALLGTPDYMSPEQVRGGAVDARSDLFCLAEVLYSLLVGHPPFRGRDLAEIFNRLLTTEPEPPSASLPAIPPALDAVLARALAKAPDDRYPSGERLAEALEAVLRTPEDRPDSPGVDQSEAAPGMVVLDHALDSPAAASQDSPRRRGRADLPGGDDEVPGTPEPVIVHRVSGGGGAAVAERDRRARQTPGERRRSATQAAFPGASVDGAPTAAAASPARPRQAPSPAKPASATARPREIVEPRRRFGLRPLLTLLLLVLVAAGLYALTVDADTARRQREAVRGWMSPAVGWVDDQITSLAHAGGWQRVSARAKGRLRSEAEVRLADGEVLLARGRWDEARRALERSLEASGEAGDGAGEAAALRAVARLEATLGRPDRALADAEAALTIDRVYEQPRGQAESLALIAGLRRDLGDPAGAAASTAEALAAADRLGDSGLRDRIQLEQGLAALVEQRFADARKELEAVCDRTAATAEWQLAARAVSLIAVADFAEGDARNAIASWRSARVTCERAPECAAELRLLEGAAAVAEGEVEEAARVLGRAESWLREADRLPGLATVLELQTEIACRQGDLTEAGRRFDELATVRRQLGLGPPPVGDRPDASPVSEPTSDPCHRLLEVLSGIPRTPRSELQLAAIAADCGLGVTAHRRRRTDLREGRGGEMVSVAGSP